MIEIRCCRRFLFESMQSILIGSEFVTTDLDGDLAASSSPRQDRQRPSRPRQLLKNSVMRDFSGSIHSFSSADSDTPSMLTCFRRPVCPLRIVTALRETLNALARTRISSSLAAPSTGGAARSHTKCAVVFPDYFTARRTWRHLHSEYQPAVANLMLDQSSHANQKCSGNGRAHKHDD